VFEQFDVDRGDGNHGMAGCDHYNCGSGPTWVRLYRPVLETFDWRHRHQRWETASPVLAYYFKHNEVGSIELNTSPALLDTPNFVLPTLPRAYTNSGRSSAQEQFL